MGVVEVRAAVWRVASLGGYSASLEIKCRMGKGLGEVAGGRVALIMPTFISVTFGHHMKARSAEWKSIIHIIAKKHCIQR